VKEFAPKPPDYRIVMEFGRKLLQNLPELPEVEKSHTLSVNSTTGVTQVSKPRSDNNHFGDTSGGRSANREVSQERSTVRFPKDSTERHWERLVKNDWQDWEEKTIGRRRYKSNSDVTERLFSSDSPTNESNPDFELLQALTHEIRTPLTTIRTLTKLLLKRRDLPAEVMRRLEIIDHECTEQINRMELIFRAAELENAAVKQSAVNLTSMSVAQVFQQSIPRWQKQAERRNLTLNVILPPNLPTVVSNPAMLDQVLSGLVENFTRTLPGGSHIQVEVTTAGDQLKLQFQSQSDPENSSNSANLGNGSCRSLKSIGQLLMFQPETGSLCLNLKVTKHLFQALGGKLIVRQRPQEGEVMTIFLPLEVGGGINYEVKLQN
jgi:nitrogen-specific signal transduction histidine kinase